MPNPQTMPAADNFETLVSELDAIVLAMEAGNLPLEDALNKYQRGVELIKQCQAKLSAAEQRIKILEDETLTPFENNKSGN